MANEIIVKTTNIEKIDYKQIKKWVLDIVSKKTLDRSALILECIANFKLTKEELKNTSSDSVFTKAKSRIGSVLAKLINDGDFILDDKKVKLNKKVQDIIKEEEISQIIVEILSKQGNKTKKEILDLIVNKAKASKLNLDLKDLRSLSGISLAGLTKTGAVLLNNSLYSLSEEKEFPSNEIGKCLKDAQKSKDIFPYFIEAFNIKGGEFFEEYTTKLIGKYLAKYSTINSSKVTGGPTDDGIDGIISYTDALGFKEIAFIQAKVRNKGAITLKEVREFFGSLCADKGTRGIFITNAGYHSEAIKFIAKQDNLVGIDGKQLFELAKSVQHGVIKTDKGLALDKSIFIV